MIRAIGSVSRVTEEGIALEFLAMKLESFSFLQTALLCKAIHPAEVSREFLVNDFLKLDGEMIYFFPHRLNLKELKNWADIL